MKNYSSTFIPSSKIHRWYCSYTLAIYNHIFRADSVPRKLKMLTKLVYKEKQTKLQLYSKAKKSISEDKNFLSINYETGAGRRTSKYIP